MQAVFRAYALRKLVISKSREDYAKILEELGDTEAINLLQWRLSGPCFPSFSVPVNRLPVELPKPATPEPIPLQPIEITTEITNDTPTNMNTSAEITNEDDVVPDTVTTPSMEEVDAIDPVRSLSPESNIPQNDAVPPMTPPPRPPPQPPVKRNYFHHLSPPPLPPSILDLPNGNSNSESLQAIKEARRKHLEEELKWAQQAIKTRKEHLKLMRRMKKLNLN